MASISDTKDRHASLVAIGGLLLGLKFFADAGQALAPPELRSALALTALALALAGAFLIVPILVWKLRHLSPSERRSYFSPESFTARVVGRAQAASWNVTLLALIGLDVLHGAESVPGSVVVPALIGLAFTVFAGAFLVLSREPSTEGDDG